MGPWWDCSEPAEEKRNAAVGWAARGAELWARGARSVPAEEAKNAADGWAARGTDLLARGGPAVITSVLNHNSESRFRRGKIQPPKHSNGYANVC